MLLIAVLLYTACTPMPSSETLPTASPAPRVPYTSTHFIKYWPEDADYESCEYSCVVELPEFSRTYTAGYAMNVAVSEYLSGLEKRIDEDYIMNSTAENPHTDVSLSVEYLPGCTNIIFTEVHSYDDSPYTQTQVLMLDEYGRELSLADIFRDYHTAERISRLIAGSVGCDEVTALAASDIINGAKATLAGCTVYARAGVLSPKENGETVFEFSTAELSPASDFDAVDLKEYETISELLSMVCTSQAVRQENITEGELSPFAASAFMGEFILSRGYIPSAGRIEVKKAEFENLYRKIFGNDFPEIDTDGHDIKLQEGVYSIRDSSKAYEYHVDFHEVDAQANSITVRGDMIYGAYGYAFSSYVCKVYAVLERSSESPFGFKLIDFTMSV